MTKVSVLMPVYNGEKYLAQAIESIGFQSFTDWELIIVDDGSTDSSREIAARYRDNRIYYLKNAKNEGLIYTRNRLIELASGEYIAFLDCDDLAAPKRLEAQVNFLDKHPDYAMCGTWGRTIDDERVLRKMNLSVGDEEIKCTLLYTNTFIQSSVMIRKKVLKEHPYDKDFPLAEDYELWCRLSREYKLYNIPRKLTEYRYHGTNISQSKKAALEDLVNEIHRRELRYIGIEPTDEELYIHAGITNKEACTIPDADYFAKLRVWMKKLAEHAIASGRYDADTWKAVSGFRWIFACTARKAYGKVLSFPVALSFKAFVKLTKILVSRI
ncbi:glycosyltransferase family A protein [Dysgonomonas sp. 25]|uniref:glycosyltransferase family 2 protein n=1 Tax=Dysgonomonas sp. 25 TaxID=2302933 RepID=UPI0013D8CB39|nr:glycosyltransferase family A protein [Dysgonomonas sp. 25]NDV69140.1 glycosyltransferase family 2 protein [Dysgonomonas sp. 25]